MTASSIPPEASVAPTEPADLVDGKADPWLMDWNYSTQGTACTATPTPAVIQVSFKPTRIRMIDIRAGLVAGPSRAMQFRPEEIWIAYANQCQQRTLKDVAEAQEVQLDTGVPVDSLRIGVVSAFPQPEGARRELGFTEITLRARPAVN
ncbi:MAG: hypothetical protein WCF36_15205 [Candidatus Nanopelagicales bacterium]